MVGIARGAKSARVTIRRADPQTLDGAGSALAELAPSRWFDRPAVLAACARVALADGSEPLLCLVEREGRPVFALPLRMRRRIGLCEAIPLAAPLAQDIDGIGTSPTPEEIGALCDGLRTGYGVDLLNLRKVRAGATLAGALRHLSVSSSREVAAPYIDLRSFGDFPGYEASFSAKTRRARRQRRGAAEKALGPLSFTVRTLGGLCTDRGALEEAIAWKREWLAAHGEVSSVIGTAWEAAIVDVASAGGAILSMLHAGSRLVAVELGMAEGCRYQAYLGAFDPRLGRYSLGHVQMLDTIAWCYEAGFSRYELLAPPDPYKLHLTRLPTAEAIIDIRVALSPVGRLGASIEVHARSLAKRVVATLPVAARSALARLS